jgi:hypothetical protein
VGCEQEFDLVNPAGTEGEPSSGTIDVNLKPVG